jgi:hypothetical protein
MSHFYPMPFGKWRGTPLLHVPHDYLEWLVGHVELRPPLRGYVLERLHELRGTDDQASTAEIDFESLRRRFALKYHPDRGGSTAAMAAINDVFDAINNLTTTQNSHQQ